ncbi:MAG: type II toxin-antitoxin system VapC family toxin [Chthoniobacteraceae bacterium]
MSTYFDTGVLLKSYVTEKNSANADALILQAMLPIPFTHFHDIEMRTALRLKHGRGEITAAELKGALRDLQVDISEGRLAKPACDLPDVFRAAEELSSKYAAVTLARSMDILHVAAAVVIGAKTSVTFDTRQAALATKAGLKAKTQA